MADKKTAKKADISVEATAKELAKADEAKKPATAKKPEAKKAEAKAAGTASVKKEAAKPAAKKAAETKKPAAAAAKKTTAAAAKKETVKKAAYIQDNFGNSKTFDDIIAAATANFKESHKRVAVKSIDVYIKAVDNKVYYVVNGTEQGEINLF